MNSDQTSLGRGPIPELITAVGDPSWIEQASK